MVSFATNLGNLRDEIDRYIAILGRDAIVGQAVTLANGCEYLGMVSMDWVCIDLSTQQIVGTEANDYELNLKSGEANSIRLQ